MVMKLDESTKQIELEALEKAASELEQLLAAHGITEEDLLKEFCELRKEEHT